jgi:hypothetical protein
MRKVAAYIACFACALCPIASQAQIELSSGIEMSYPILLNSYNTKVNYGQISFGVKAGIAYKPENTQFFPILNLSYGRTRLPLQQLGADVACINFNYFNTMLNENYIVRFPFSQLFIYGGIGFSYLGRKNNEVAGPGGGAKEMAIDSTANVNHVFPAVNIGFEYNYGEANDKPLYLTMGFNFQYILLLAERNTYYFSVGQQYSSPEHYKAAFTGNVLSPGFYIAIHYILKKND